MDLQPAHLINEWVILRPLQEDDFNSLYQVAADPLIWEQHPNPDRYKKEVFQNYFTGAMTSKGAFLITKSTGEVIGSTRFYDYYVDKNEIKIGYTFFARACWGLPYNRSAKQLMVDYAFQFVNQVLFHVGATNIRSQRAMGKIGALKIGEEEVAYFGESPRLNFVYLLSKKSA